MAKVKKKLSSMFKRDDTKTKIISYSFSLFSIGFILYVLISVINYYVSKYVLFLLNII